MTTSERLVSAASPGFDPPAPHPRRIGAMALMDMLDFTTPRPLIWRAFGTAMALSAWLALAPRIHQMSRTLPDETS